MELFQARLPHLQFHTDSLGERLCLREVQRYIVPRSIKLNGEGHRDYQVCDVSLISMAMDRDERSASALKITAQNHADDHLPIGSDGEVT